MSKITNGLAQDAV